jgi:hypothetical protein
MDMNKKDKCKAGLWMETQPAELATDIDKSIKDGVPMLTVYRAVKMITSVPFSDKTWSRHFGGNCTC